MNLVLMAGQGKRFLDAGYTQSKPLIPVSGKPMIIRAVESMPAAQKWVFIVRPEHSIDEKEIMQTLASVSKDVTILVDPNPVGQLNSALVAREHLNTDEPVFIGACDFGMVYDRAKYAEAMSLQNPSQPDMLVWSFTRQPNLTRNPQAWGWLKVKPDNSITGVSVKVPISDDPFNDYAIEGSFSFKSGKIFLEIADELMRRGIKVKNEFYIDSMIDVAIDMGRRVVSFPVEKYIGWGTPADYEEYVWWEKAMKTPEQFPEATAKPEYSFWSDYFLHDALKEA